MNLVILGLGSNIAPEYNLPEAVRKLGMYFEINAISSLWQTTAIGTEGPVFHNAAVLIRTMMERDALKKEVLSKIEIEMGRVRGPDKYAPRTIDLDILVYGDDLLEKHLFYYDYLILPVSEIQPDLKDPETGKALSELAKERCCGSNAVNIGPLPY
jgi:2-amino-4-hydroxy-6-hydroxymethyldihydropteridine diphosphokinase